MSSQTKLLHPLAAGTALLALWIYWYWRMHPLHFSNFLSSRWFFWSRLCVTEWCFVCCCAMVQAWIYSFSYVLIVFLCIWHYFSSCLSMCAYMHAHAEAFTDHPAIDFSSFCSTEVSWHCHAGCLGKRLTCSLSFANVPVCVSVDRNSGSCIVRRPRWMVCWGAMKT